MPIEIFQVDAFTNRRFAGNPAAVCILSKPAEAEWMQNVAAEMNLSETAFVRPTSDDRFDLRWFTPTTEVDLCGHATLATVHILWQTDRLPQNSTARFDSRSGLLTARRDGEWIDLDFPATPAVLCETPAGLVESLDDDSRNHVVAIAKSRFDHLVQLDIDQSQLASMTINLAKLKAVATRGLIVTTHRTGDPRFDFASRFFAPGAGIDEDPVTGSAHCALAPWWGERLKKREMLAYQASRRGGVVRVKVRDDRVIVGGQAVTIFRGMLEA